MALPHILNNAATRAIIVGQVQSGLGVISGQVTNPLGPMGKVMIEVPKVGNAETDETTGAYLVKGVPLGTQQEVHIVLPEGYVVVPPDTETMTATLSTEAPVGTVNFHLAKQASTPIPGTCGSANGQSFLTAPTTDLCSTGMASSVSGTGPWSWTCAGSNGGTTASCSATLQSTPINGTCGSANEQSFPTAPTTDLCSTGTASPVSGTGPWNWTCAGSNGGTTASCSATLQQANSITTGAKTIGFWKNQNGQALLTGGASTSGVCNSGTWLRQYAPYQDMSATATCAQVATYVTNIIKAANASGTSMNAMLKAQMLATSLDVYFSDPTLGGNKITAPMLIGGVSIDLTRICGKIDSASGIATCSGAYQNATSAFGGSPSQTISEMLAYAASQSNVGGSQWYGNSKATQELVKNAFDAINNQVALAP